MSNDGNILWQRTNFSLVRVDHCFRTWTGHVFVYTALFLDQYFMLYYCFLSIKGNFFFIYIQLFRTELWNLLQLRTNINKLDKSQGTNFGNKWKSLKLSVYLEHIIHIFGCASLGAVFIVQLWRHFSSLQKEKKQFPINLRFTLKPTLLNKTN